MLKRSRSVSACSLSSCRLKAEALARAFNRRLWPCTWVDRRSHGSAHGDDDEEYFEAAPSPADAQDERDCSAATEQGRVKLFELLQQAASDDATEEFYDVSEHAEANGDCSHVVDRDDLDRTAEFETTEDTNSRVDFDAKETDSETKDKSFSELAIDSVHNSAVNGHSRRFSDSFLSKPKDKCICLNTNSAAINSSEDNSLRRNEFSNCLSRMVNSHGETEHSNQELVLSSESSIQTDAVNDNQIDTPAPNVDDKDIFRNTTSSELISEERQDSDNNQTDLSIPTMKASLSSDPACVFNIETDILLNENTVVFDPDVFDTINDDPSETVKLLTCLESSEVKPTHVSDQKADVICQAQQSVSIEITKALKLHGHIKDEIQPECSEGSDKSRLSVFSELRPAISRSTSLKTGKTPPGTPSRKKIVRFADVLGLDLEDVRTIISGDLPNVPSSAYSDLVLVDDPFRGKVPTTVELTCRQQGAWDTAPHQATSGPNALFPKFSIPGHQPDFMDKVRARGVCLESAIASECNVQCTCRVMNWGYNKKVVARYTVNGWASSSDINATYVSGSSRDGTDGFAFNIFLSRQNSNIELALRFEVNGMEYWDNNGGMNYCFGRHSDSNSIHASVPISPTWIHQFW